MLCVRVCSWVEIHMVEMQCMVGALRSFEEEGRSASRDRSLRYGGGDGIAEEGSMAGYALLVAIVVRLPSPLERFVPSRKGDGGDCLVRSKPRYWLSLSQDEPPNALQEAQVEII